VVRRDEVRVDGEAEQAEALVEVERPERGIPLGRSTTSTLTFSMLLSNSRTLSSSSTNFEATLITQPGTEMVVTPS
jgi:hypothetical protein